ACRTSNTLMKTIRVRGTRSAHTKPIGAQRYSQDAATLNLKDGENIMKTTHRLTIIALTTLFVVTVAVLWASTPAKVSAQTRSTFAFAPRYLTGLASQSPLAFVQ